MFVKAVIASVLIASAVPLNAQAVRTEEFHGRSAFVLENDRIRVSLLRGGGHIAEVRLRSDDPLKNVNPMRVPHYRTIDPHRYDPAKHDELYGTDPHRWLSSGYMGHLLCFPAFGPPSSPSEVANGLGNHGEAPIVEWKPIDTPQSASAVHFRYGADLPKTQYRIERTVSIPQGESVAYFEESALSLVDYDRPINWVQHATLGPPFVAPGKNILDLSGTVGLTSDGAPATSSLMPKSDVRWPDGIGRDGSKVSLRPFQNVDRAGTYFAVLMDQARPISYFTVYNEDYRILLGYLFRTADSPWIGDFQENKRMQQKPWTGETITRGIEFGTTPFAEGLQRSVKRGSLFGVPTYRWIGGRERLKTTFAIFVAEIPEGFRGVANVDVKEASLVIHERGSNRTITLSASQVALLK